MLMQVREKGNNPATVYEQCYFADVVASAAEPQRCGRKKQQQLEEESV